MANGKWEMEKPNELRTFTIFHLPFPIQAGLL